MGSLNSSLTKEEVNLLIEAMSDWEATGNHDFHVLEVVNKHPMPDEEHETYQLIKDLKEHFRKREKDIKNSRMVRQERAILIKAKLVMIRQDLGVGQLFHNSSIPTNDTPDPGEQEPQKQVATDTAVELAKALAPQSNPNPDLLTKLELAEYYIKDLGVWKQYQAFIQEREEASTKDAGWHHE